MSMSLVIEAYQSGRVPSSFAARHYARRAETDRCLLMAAGVGLTLIGLASRGVAGWLLAGIGGYLAYKHAECPRDWIEENETLSGPSQTLPYTEDRVDEASMDSFPASDPPALSPRRPPASPIASIKD